MLLNDTKLRHYLYAIIALAVACALAFILLSIAKPDAEGQVKLEDPPIEKDEEHILALDREALDKAYKDHIGLVFGVWMKDPRDPRSAERAGVGARNARMGYAISRDKIEQRERKLKEKAK